MLRELRSDHQHDDVLQALRFVRRFELAIDCGAHRGIVTRLLASRFAKVVAIEPSEYATDIHGANVQVVQKALGDKPGRCAMEHGTVNTGQRHVVPGDDYELITLDSLALTPDFIKIDVEGMEWHVLYGAEQTIRQHRPVIMFEENKLNQRYGIADGSVGELLEQWGAQRVLVLEHGRRDQDWIYVWPEEDSK